MAEDFNGSQSQDVTNQTQPPAEKMIPASKVNELIHERTAAVAERAKREALEEFQKQQTSSMGGLQSMSQDEIKRMISEEAKKQAEQQTEMALAYKVASEFRQKMSAGKDKYPDFDKDMELLDLPSIPHVVELANSQDNTVDIMHELKENPGKLTIIAALAVTNPRLARLEMNKLSSSIKENSKAAQTKLPNEPLGQVSPSKVGVDNGQMSVKDLKKQPWLRA